ncbi:DNA replication/repair protein RecF [Maledivibacter halophilus]|uniref:DNA replication and repair protein RecF n=1 Tax=Maledivibacter halophilus TaxID=36842 RepID=A0A1T5MLT6_9FIRM|nr:DNA replication/repair protein RecF [Maledivibacter halophilus]SKC88858.1 DNA replication and repair protein RecF [Maledivibacter halophilus]
MFISKLKLINFRNYNKLDIILHDKLNIFIGNNAQGKTNILESLYVTGFGKSFRTNKDKELIKMNKDMAYIKAEGKKRYGEISIELRLWNNRNKEIKTNGISLTKLSELLGSINIVIFSPEDLKLIKGGPSERRRFIDREISHVNKKYYYNIMSYNKVLLQRNNLLKNIAYNKKLLKTIDIWNEKLVEYGTEVIFKRIEFIKKLNMLSRLMNRRITEGKENLEIKYLSNIKIDKKYKTQDIYESFKQMLEKKIDNDIKRGFTTVGPHKDDLGIYIDNKDIRIFGSQGQQRTAALSLKLSEIEIIKGEIGEYPILLLDDVMSELDINRQKFLIKSLKNVQTFITITELPELMIPLDKEGSIFKISNGSIVQNNDI